MHTGAQSNSAVTLMFFELILFSYGMASNDLNLFKSIKEIIHQKFVLFSDKSPTYFNLKHHILQVIYYCNMIFPL